MSNDQQNPRSGAPIPPGRQDSFQRGTDYQQAVQQPYAGSDQQNQQAGFVPQQPAPMQHKKSGTMKTFWIAFAGAAAACIIAIVCFIGFNATTGKSATGSVVLGSGETTTINADEAGEDRAEAVADKVLPSVVGIAVYTNSTSSYYNLFGGSSSNSGQLTESSLGSGVILSTDGYILTNYHVIEGAAQLIVTADGQDYEATVVGTDETSDLAVIKIDATGLTPIEIGSSSDLKAGQWVMTAGSPFGLEQSVATGIISATSRTVVVSSSSSSYSNSSSSSSSVYSNMIQTDAAINPGNSGGALVNQNGALIGINAVIESYSGNYSGVGFAIPVDYAVNIAQQIIAGKTPTHAQLGVSATTIDSSIAQRYGLSADKGAYISTVYSGSGAENAGLKQGDIITKVNNTTVESATDLIAAVRSCNIGDTVSVEYNRDGSTETASVVLGSDENSSSSKSSSSSSGSSGSSGNNGFSFNYGGNSNSSSSSNNAA